MTPVIFRRFKNGGDVIAIFPTIPGDMHHCTCSSYQHVGQHAACNPTYLIRDMTTPAAATDADVIALQKELVGQGYDDLVVIKRARYRHYLERKSNA